MTKFRRWLHDRGVHHLCRVRQERTSVSYREVMKLLEREFDVTNQDGSYEYRTVHV